MVDFFDSLEGVKRQTKRTNLIMEPIEGKGIPESSWLMVKDRAQTPLRKAIGKSSLEAQEGINTRGGNSIFYLDVLDRKHGLCLVENMNEEGRSDVEQKKKWVEDVTVYPLLRGKDVDRWHVQPSGHILVPNDPRTGDTISERDMKVKNAKAYDFLLEFKSELQNRTHYSRPIREIDMPFYTLFQVNKSNFSAFKVVWKEISGEISGKGDFAAAVVSSEEKPIIEDHKLMFVSFKNEDEAYFVAAVLNSSISRLIVASYTIETSMSTHLLKHIRVPDYDKDNDTHTELARKAKEAHKHYGDPERLEGIEKEIDTLVAQLFDVSTDELEVLQESLDILMS